MPETILLFGAQGQLGFELQSALRGLGDVLTQDRAQADLSQPEALREIVRRVRPTLIVNAAAYTAVDRAESEAELAHAVNAVAPGVLAEEANTLSAILVHYSTDYVFDGTGASAYKETAMTNPVSIYAATKLEGEQRVLAANPRSLVLRTSWVYGRHGSNFLKTMLRMAQERDELNVVDDQVGAPTSAARIARATAQILSQMGEAGPEDLRWGLYHLTNSGETTWHAYARHALGQAGSLGVRLKVKPEAIRPISTADYPTPAARPANSRLDTSKLRQAFGVELPDWKIDMAPVITALATASDQKAS